MIDLKDKISEGFFANVGADKYINLKDLYNRMELFITDKSSRTGAIKPAKWKEGAEYFITLMSSRIGDIHINITEDWENGWEELYKSIVSLSYMKGEDIPINIVITRNNFHKKYNIKGNVILYITGPEDRPALSYYVDNEGNAVFDKVMRDDVL